MIFRPNGSRVINRVPPLYYVTTLVTQEMTQEVFLKEENNLYIIPINFLFLQFK